MEIKFAIEDKERGELGSGEVGRLLNYSKSVC